jgi:hypothetical protein
VREEVLELGSTDAVPAGKREAKKITNGAK